jgi:Domain of unknown function (DUF4249)
MRNSPSTRLALVGALGLAVASIAACDLEFEKVNVPTGRSRPAVHAVLNPFVFLDFTVLLERTLSGRVSVQEGRVDPADPIVTGGGDPITGARVIIRNADGSDEGVGIEVAEERTDGKGRGVYHFVNAPCAPFFCPPNGIVLRRGGSYVLDIQTTTGELLHATTTIPTAFPRADTLLRRTFDASRDTYVFKWPPAESLDRYAVQIQTPFGPFQTFSNVESLAVNGSLRNFQQDRFPRVFVPGFRQALHAFAVDQHYFAYFRSANDEFTGQGLVSNIEGGTGVFGAIHPIREQDLDVVAPFDEPVDGRWALIGDTTRFPPRLTTYADGAFLSGRLENVFDPELQTLRGILGSRSGNTLRFAVLHYMSLSDTAWTMVAEVHGDTLVTTASDRGEQRWLRTATAP